MYIIQYLFQFDNNNITVSINGAQEKDNINDVHSERGIKVTRMDVS